MKRTATFFIGTQLFRNVRRNVTWQAQDALPHARRIHEDFAHFFALDSDCRADLRTRLR